MGVGIINTIFRVLAFLLGLAFLAMASFMVYMGNFDLWVGFILGPLLVFYSIYGNKGLLGNRWLSGYGRDIGK